MKSSGASTEPWGTPRRKHFLLGRHFKLITDQKSVSFMFHDQHRNKIKNEKILRTKKRKRYLLNGNVAVFLVPVMFAVVFERDSASLIVYYGFLSFFVSGH